MVATLSGIIIRRRARDEHDLLVDMYLERCGRVSVRARGALRRESKLRGHLEPGRLVQGLITGTFPRMGMGDVLTLENFVTHDGSSWWYQGLLLGLWEAFTPWGSYNITTFELLISSLRAIRNAPERARGLLLRDALLHYAKEYGIEVWYFFQCNAPSPTPTHELYNVDIIASCSVQ